MEWLNKDIKIIYFHIKLKYQKIILIQLMMIVEIHILNMHKFKIRKNCLLKPMYGPNLS